ncbi:hypothetical protein IWW45_006429, partial [Coemansia sp. RSA 485]
MCWLISLRIKTRTGQDTSLADKPCAPSLSDVRPSQVRPRGPKPAQPGSLNSSSASSDSGARNSDGEKT